MSHPYLLDCDTGVDDALALLYLLAHPQVNLVGVSTVSGNVTAAQAGQNTLNLLALAGFPQVPVAVGAMDPLAGEFDGGAPHVHGENGVGDVELPVAQAKPAEESGPEMIIRLAAQYPGELRLIAIGPLTNLALALELDPDLPSKINHLTVMGGAVHASGNISPVAEANIGNDPEAAALVFAADWPITLVPLDVTMLQRLEEPARQQLLCSKQPAVRATGEMLGVYFDFYIGVFGHPSSALHDPLAAAIATGEIVPELAPVVSVVIDDSAGPGRGQTIADLRGSYLGYPPVDGGHCAVVLQVSTDFAPILVSRILSL